MKRGVNERARRKGRNGRLYSIIGAVVFVAALLYWEQAALLFILSTLAVCALLLVVAFSDLEGRNREAMLREQAAPVGDGSMSEAGAPRTERRVAKQRRHEAA